MFARKGLQYRLKATKNLFWVSQRKWNKSHPETKVTPKQKFSWNKSHSGKKVQLEKKSATPSQEAFLKNQTHVKAVKNGNTSRTLFAVDMGFTFWNSYNCIFVDDL